MAIARKGSPSDTPDYAPSVATAQGVGVSEQQRYATGSPALSGRLYPVHDWPGAGFPLLWSDPWLVFEAPSSLTAYKANNTPAGATCGQTFLACATILFIVCGVTIQGFVRVGWHNGRNHRRCFCGAIRRYGSD